MRKLLMALCVGVALSATMYAQDKGTQKLASAKVKTLDGKLFSTDSLQNNGKPMIVSFWATWCKPCINELNTISEVYEEWKTETGVKLVAISIDDARTMNSVKPFINGKNWPYEVYLDPNSDFKRAMNVGPVPHTFLVNGKGEIVSQHTSFSPGDEEKLLEEIKKLVAGN
ncbi:MAG TPA: TlpA disulfide reductase family protein [Bacteroidia bacterium]|nr:TlpA disulfide reductase family protein [Bacteroidia bacterium]